MHAVCYTLCTTHAVCYTCCAAHCATHAVLRTLCYTCCAAHTVLHTLCYTHCATRCVLHTPACAEASARRTVRSAPLAHVPCSPQPAGAYAPRAPTSHNVSPVSICRGVHTSPRTLAGKRAEVCAVCACLVGINMAGFACELARAARTSPCGAGSPCAAAAAAAA